MDWTPIVYCRYLQGERIGGRGLALTSRAFQPKSSIDNLINAVPKSEKEEK